jgi:hypothetical protein
VIGVAALELVAFRKGAREVQREGDERDARRRRQRGERRGLAGNRHRVGHEGVEHRFLGASLADAKRGEMILRERADRHYADQRSRYVKSHKVKTRLKWKTYTETRNHRSTVFSVFL